MIFISPTFYKNKIKDVYDCPGKLVWCFFLLWLRIFFSAYTK